MQRERRHVLLGGAALLAAAAGMRTARGQDQVIKVTARKFSFTPAEIVLKKGQPVTLELSTEDVFMGFSAPDFKMRSDIVPGKTMRLTFTPDKAGTFPFICDVFCGDGHESMSGKLLVT